MTPGACCDNLSARGYAVNPWTRHSRFVVSHHLLRDEDYAATLRDRLDDTDAGASLLILDEAHNAAPASGARYAIDSRREVIEVAIDGSCERRNDFLDRALVVPTVDDTDAAFFDAEA